MKYYVQFLTYDLAGKLSEALGSDGIHPLDGRLNIHSMIREARMQIYRLRKVQTYDGFKIMQGTLRCSSVIYKEES